MENRRQFTRILFSIQAELEIDEGIFPISILDISLNGALITKPKYEHSLLKKLGILRFKLADENANVIMHIAIVHEDKNEIGLRVNALDIDSISHIRRMVELNLGDNEQLNKELSQLTVNH